MLDKLFVSTYKGVTYLSKWGPIERASISIATGAAFLLLGFWIIFFKTISLEVILIPCFSIYIYLLFRYNDKNKVLRIRKKYRNISAVYGILFWIFGVGFGILMGFLHQEYLKI